MKVPLRTFFPELFSLAQDLASPILSNWLDNEWNIKVPELNHVEFSAKMEELMRLLLSHLHLDIGARDRSFWDLDPNETFSVRNTYFRLNDGGLRCPFCQGHLGS